MGRDLAHRFAVAREVFDEADDALGFAISDICFDGPEDKLKLTEFTQPAILTNSVAILRTLQAEKGLTFDIAAGHSLGEFSALVAAGALSLRDAVKLVHIRGRAMQEAVPAGQGGMAAIMGLDADKVQELCDEARADQVCMPANLNGASQIVISGHKEAVERAVAAAKGKGARRAVILQVSAPFHSALMTPAAEKLAEAMANIEFGQMTVPVVSNVEATENRDASRVADLLVRQVTGTVRWEASVQRLLALDVTQAYELGSGSVLRGLARRIAKGWPVDTIGEPHEVDGFDQSSDT